VSATPLGSETSVSPSEVKTSPHPHGDVKTSLPKMP